MSLIFALRFTFNSFYFFKERQQNSYEDSRGWGQDRDRDRDRDQGHSTHRDRPHQPAWGVKHRPNCAGGDESYCLYDRDYPM